ncbi:uncharacterized protein A1O5_12901 [Cladophialophora psammophila CBS 110553]|uniref:Uncharacterized protein n=1 Tax=Cladophialophora psammophila CBS 110553 TaxID=1182543 RepID=W9VPQ9_9EURO|nr:uncharacterized protein A1O5_12901 [Cladophialophora psammophila CBS 110553]EXJ54990.1 hypothetical protein A1O5_12901 [Cladophialophora psammophila CBS 110553]
MHVRGFRVESISEVNRNTWENRSIYLNSFCICAREDQNQWTTDFKGKLCTGFFFEVRDNLYGRT